MGSQNATHLMNIDEVGHCDSIASLRRCLRRRSASEIATRKLRVTPTRNFRVAISDLATSCPKFCQGRSQIGPAERGDVEQDKEPSLKQVAPGEVPEIGTMRMRETVLAEVAQRSPTSPETNLESRAMQVRVPWNQAWLCTKDFRRKCTGAGVAAKVAVPSNAAQRGEARTYLHQTWAEELLDCGSHLDGVAGFEGPRSSC
ncbi:hypothetical protein NDU88_000112 [Pleurodeles waltl]|uniref:Uncharacterized protein n=1 Tax=Pleurodeles waltl TaxID=8319 RepID=A0AAV7WEJ3_PLEWA|nr:hypothetical protein NDU88_000112 [Pleurodeles waltl]